MAGRSKFTRVPKAEDLIPQLREAGIGLHVLPTYHALLDHANNQTGRAWPSINRLASILGLCRRTVERHLQALQSAGLVLSNGQRRGRRGRFSVCRYVVVAVLFFKRSTVRHGGRTSKRGPINREHKRIMNTPKPPTETQEDRRKREAAERRDSYEWLFE